MTAPEQKPKETAEEFLSRWSKRKQELRAEAQAPRPVQPAAPAGSATTPAPELPPVDKLNMDSDYSGFFHPKVDEALRRKALKKLFSDPHFNIMDGLDTYIDDYSISDPIPAAMLAQMKSAQDILAWSRETEKEAELRRNPPPVDEKPVIADKTNTVETSPAADAAEPKLESKSEPEPTQPASDDDKRNA